MAVGDVDFGTGTPLSSAPVIEHWDGTSWQMMPTPDTFGGLTGISCPRPNVCFAVGGPNELWDGTSWSIQARIRRKAALEDVSCSGLLACTAVGLRSENGSLFTYAERWDGTLAGAVHPEPRWFGQQQSARRLVSAETHLHGRRPVDDPGPR